MQCEHLMYVQFTSCVQGEVLILKIASSKKMILCWDTRIYLQKIVLSEMASETSLEEGISLLSLLFRVLNLCFKAFLLTSIFVVFL